MTTVQWDAPPGIVHLTDGTTVLVQLGDELLAEEDEDGTLLFHAHERPPHN